MPTRVSSECESKTASLTKMNYFWRKNILSGKRDLLVLLVASFVILLQSIQVRLDLFRSVAHVCLHEIMETRKNYS